MFHLARSATPAPRKAPASVPAASVTPERAARLSKLLELLSLNGKPRQVLLTKLDLDLRGFYRDLKTLRERGIAVRVGRDIYRLDGELDSARAKLPCPDPYLSLAELEQLSKGRTEAHRKLQKLLHSMLGTKPAKKAKPV